MYVVNPKESWKLGSESINYVQPGQVERYLGARTDSWIGVEDISLGDKLIDWCGSLYRATLKPDAKLMMDGVCID